MIRKFFENKQLIINFFLVIAILGMIVFLFAHYNKEKNRQQEQLKAEEQNPLQTLTPDEISLFDSVMNPSENEAQPAYDFSLSNLDGETVTLADFLGTPVLVNFWATWCPPCKAEMPIIQNYAAKHQEELVVLAVNAGEEKAVVQNFVNNHDLDDLEFLLDPNNDISSLYRIPGFPTSLFIDAEGLLQGIYIGGMDEGLLTHYLEKIGVE